MHEGTLVVWIDTTISTPVVNFGAKVNTVLFVTGRGCVVELALLLLDIFRLPYVSAFRSMARRLSIPLSLKVLISPIAVPLRLKDSTVSHKAPDALAVVELYVTAIVSGRLHGDAVGRDQLGVGIM